MGFLDDVRRLKQLQQENPQLSRQELQQLLEDEKRQAHHGDYAPGAVKPYVEVVPPKAWKADLDRFVADYIGIVGLQPEDVFAVYPEPNRETPGTLTIIYRDRPEYADGRRRHRRLLLGE
ncbi:hypothetical protein AB0K11_21440 [Mycobacterium sp. NPDC050551]|uniref:hypothetical protein n=1 Tax=Mycobacterium sp. NPDC050551 TaxID=3155407 RepID=UPI0034216C06